MHNPHLPASNRPVHPIIGTLRTLRVKSGLTQQELAARIHSSRSSVNRWECGTCDPPLSMLAAWCTAFDAPLTITGIPTENIVDVPASQLLNLPMAPATTTSHGRPIITCSACGAQAANHGRGWCHACYMRWLYHGKPAYGPPAPGSIPRAPDGTAVRKRIRRRNKPGQSRLEGVSARQEGTVRALVQEQPDAELLLAILGLTATKEP